ncbi:unnamed protein product, partial [Iphiclides podalirius]
MEKHDEINNKNVSQSLVADYGTSDSESEEAGSRPQGQIINDDSDNTELSEMVLKNNIINACAHGPLSTASARKDVEITRHMIIDNSESGVVEYEVTEYRDFELQDSDSSSSDEGSVESVESIDDLFSGDENGGEKIGKVEPIKVHGELGLDDLPPIEDLVISLDSKDTTKIGVITSIVDRLVVVRAYPATPALDLDTILFLESGRKALGKVFDVFGPVTEPNYCVRFNSQDHVKQRGIEPGMEVYIAPGTSCLTKYVFLTELMKAKGSDASWLYDVEPPPNHVDYSDDEEERRANKSRREQSRQGKEATEGGETSRQQARKEAGRGQRPCESSSRFGGGPSRGRNPFVAARRSCHNPAARFVNPWTPQEIRTPSAIDHSAHSPFAPYSQARMRVPPFNPATPPPFMANAYQFGVNPTIRGPMHPMNVLPYRNGPIFGAGYNGPQMQWVARPPPPPGS